MSEVDMKEEKPIQHSKKSTHILILGSGFAGIEVLKRLQRKFQKKHNIDITLVSRDNFLLFTPMLHEVSSGMIEIRHIVTPIRTFCPISLLLVVAILLKCVCTGSVQKV